MDEPELEAVLIGPSPNGPMLLPPKPGVCQACAVDHEPTAPHNQQSLHYQYWFYFQHDRWPTWADALEHCDPETRAAWVGELAKHGVVVE